MLMGSMIPHWCKRMNSLGITSLNVGLPGVPVPAAFTGGFPGSYWGNVYDECSTAGRKRHSDQATTAVRIISTGDTPCRSMS